MSLNLLVITTVALSVNTTTKSYVKTWFRRGSSSQFRKITQEPIWVSVSCGDTMSLEDNELCPRSHYRLSIDNNHFSHSPRGENHELANNHTNHELDITWIWPTPLVRQIRVQNTRRVLGPLHLSPDWSILLRVLKNKKNEYSENNIFCTIVILKSWPGNFCCLS